MEKIGSEESRAEILRIKKDEMKTIKITKHLNRNQIITKASLLICQQILSKQLPFSHGELVKECIYLTMEQLLTHHKDSAKILSEIKNLQLSRQTVARRSEVIGRHIKMKLRKMIKNAAVISICLDDSTDRNDLSQLVVFSRMVLNKCVITNEILGLVALKNTTTSDDLYEALQEIFSRYAFNEKHLTSITTDSAASMVGCRNGLTTKMKSINNHLISLRCIIHQESLCAKTGIKEAKPFADIVMKFTNKAIACGATKHRQFVQFLEGNDPEFKDISKMQQVRWLSCEKTFREFLAILPLIKEFLNQNGDLPAELNNKEWEGKLCFFTDLSSKLASLNEKMTG